MENSGTKKCSSLVLWQKVLTAVFLGGIAVSVLFCLFLMIFLFHSARQEDITWEKSRPQDEISFVKLFGTPANVREGEQDSDKKDIELRIRDKKVKAKLLSISKNLAQKQKELKNELLSVNENSSPEIVDAKVKNLKKEISDLKKDFALHIRLAYRFAWTYTYQDLYYVVEYGYKMNYCDWDQVTEEIDSAN